MSWSFSTPLKGGIPPPPLRTCCSTFAGSEAAGSDVRSGPPLPPVPLAPWQTEQLSAKTCWPASAAAAAPAPVVPPAGGGGGGGGGGGVAVIGVSPAWAAASAAAPGFTGPSFPSSENSQRLSPWEVPARLLPPA